MLHSPFFVFSNSIAILDGLIHSTLRMQLAVTFFSAAK
jgi:hypothetical protein